jgi:uncharacterized membrane protein YgaE (UPF0421/DUF939 family)
MSTEQMLIAAVGALAAAVVSLFWKLQKREDQLIELAKRINNGFTDILQKVCEILDKYGSEKKESRTSSN